MENSSNFATIGAVYDDGVTLIFDGETQASTKHYHCNASIEFKAGKRVKIFRDSGTVVVEYMIGPDYPKFYVNGTSYRMDEGATFSTWISSSYNTDGYSIDTRYGESNIFFLYKSGTYYAYIGRSRSTAIVEDKNYTLDGDGVFYIAGVEQEVYVGMYVRAWVSTSFNTAGYSYVDTTVGETTGYFFTLNGTPVAYIGTSLTSSITNGRQFVMP